MSTQKKNRSLKAFQLHAAKAVRQLARLEQLIAPDADLQPRERHIAHGYQRVPVAAIEKAIQIASQQGIFPDFGLAEARDAALYERVMSEVSEAARTLASHIDTSILKRRLKPASDTLALYEALKGTARMRGDLYEHVQAMRALVSPKRKAKAKKAAADAQQPAPAPAVASNVPAQQPDAAGGEKPAPVTPA